MEMISTPTVADILDAMRASQLFYLKTWPGLRAPRLWRRTTRGYAPVTPEWLRMWLQPVAAGASHTLAVKVPDADLSCFPPVPPVPPVPEIKL